MKTNDGMFIHNAIIFATLKHQGQLRKCTQVPYITHPKVINLVFFENEDEPYIGYADNLGSGMRNLYKYVPLYANGKEPQLIEGDFFQTIIPLPDVDNPPDSGKNPNGEPQVTEKNGKVAFKPADVADKVADITPSEKTFIKNLGNYFAANEWINNNKACEITGLAVGSVKRYLRNLTTKGLLEAAGENKTRRYRFGKSYA
jgi:ATP-dependent DNA helicase RecG